LIEKIAKIQNIKQLDIIKTVHFNDRINLIYGCNGSGKSTLCEILKRLSNDNEKNTVSDLRSKENTKINGSVAN